jgi:hypothetical protein
MELRPKMVYAHFHGQMIGRVPGTIGFDMGLCMRGRGRKMNDTLHLIKLHYLYLKFWECTIER